MSNWVSFKNSNLEYIKKQDTEIITVLGFQLIELSDLTGLIKNFELLAKRMKIKEVWFPFQLEFSMKDLIIKQGYKECILGVHPVFEKELIGYKKLIR
jgi:hypothetical protein